MAECLAIDGRPLELHAHDIKAPVEDEDLDRDNEDDDYDFKILMQAAEHEEQTNEFTYRDQFNLEHNASAEMREFLMQSEIPDDVSSPGNKEVNV